MRLQQLSPHRPRAHRLRAEDARAGAAATSRRVNSFTVTPKTIVNPGDKVTLSWDTKDAKQLFLEQVGKGQLAIDSTMPAGMCRIAANGATTFVLTAIGEGAPTRRCRPSRSAAAASGAVRRHSEHGRVRPKVTLGVERARAPPR